MLSKFSIKNNSCLSLPANPGKSFIQPKLTINNPNDKFEQEADAVANKIMSREAPSLQMKTSNNLFFKPAMISVSLVQCKCAHCEEEEKKSDSNRMQRKEMNGEETSADENLESYVRNLDSSGQPLPNEVRNFYEPRFDYDFRNVKVHTDAAAAKSTQSINALAYTSGNNIVFNNGQYAPDTDRGKRLLGHELTHVVQQSRSNPQVSPFVQRARWGMCPTTNSRGERLTRRSGGNPLIYAPAELYAVAQYKARYPSHCVMTNEELAAGIIPSCNAVENNMIQQIIHQFHRDRSPARRRGVRSTNEVTERAESTGIHVEEAMETVQILLQPDIIDFTSLEVYDVTTDRQASSKRRKISNIYVPRLRMLTHRSWDAGRALSPFTPIAFSIPPTSYEVCFGPTDFAVYPGVIQYMPLGSSRRRRRRRRRRRDRRRDRERRRRERQRERERRRSRSERQRRQRQQQRDRRRRQRERQRRQRQRDRERRQWRRSAAGGGGFNFGFGISIGGSSAGVGNVGVGVSIMSNGVSVGTVTAGASVDSDGVAAGTASAGASVSSQGAAAGAATAGASVESASAGAGVAGAGSSVESTTAGAGTAGTGSMSGVTGAAAGRSGAVQEGEQEGVEGSADGGTNETGTTTAREQNGQNSSSEQQGGQEGAGGQQTGGATGSEQQTGEGGQQLGQGGAGGQQTGTGGGPQQPRDQRGGGQDAGQARDAAFSLPGLTTEETNRVVQEAARIDRTIQSATPAQLSLLRHLAEQHPDGIYTIPSEQWINMILSATDGISEDDIAFLETLQWEPGLTTIEELRQNIRQVIETRRQGQSESEETAEGEENHEPHQAEAPGPREGRQRDRTTPRERGTGSVDEGIPLEQYYREMMEEIRTYPNWDQIPAGRMIISTGEENGFNVSPGTEINATIYFNYGGEHGATRVRISVRSVNLTSDPQTVHYVFVSCGMRVFEGGDYAECTPTTEEQTGTIL